MKIPLGLLYLSVSAYGIYWAHHMITRRHTSSSVAYWYLDLLFGGIILGIGAILRWTRWRARTSWLPVLGNAMVATYYVGASAVTLHRRFAGSLRAGIPEIAIALLPVMLMIMLLCLSLFEKFLPELIDPSGHPLGPGVKA